MNTIIIGGCPRSGTGALANLLTEDGRAIVTLEKGLDAWKKYFDKKSDFDKSKLIYVGDKMPESYLANADRLYKQFPNAKFIFTNRNGYGVVASYARRPLKRHRAEDIPKENLIRKIKFGEKVWMRNYKKLKNLHNILPRDKYILLRYEDNCNNLTNMLIKLGKFLEYNTQVKNKSYKPTHLDWVKGIEFWEDIILTTVSDEFNYLVNEYDINVERL